ncbi:response regulator [Marinibacterium sp. SX1]|uniref:response regulator n=1 Tax=Marinibacterium sp. SX1 TaxID=3388424 RepID=UPI003D170FBF
MRILLVEDDPLVGDALVKSLGRDRARVDWIRDGEAAATALASGGFDLVVLDLGLPGRDGLSVLRDLRDRGDATPVLVLTARDGVEDRILGLDNGADDYLLKPFDTGELLARCRALLRRAQGRGDDRITLDALTVDLGANSVAVDGRPLHLPQKEFRLLVYLAERRGRVVPKAQLEQMLYGWDDGAESNTVEVYVSALRRKIGADRIRTLRGVGYMIP